MPTMVVFLSLRSLFIWLLFLFFAPSSWGLAGKAWVRTAQAAAPKVDMDSPSTSASGAGAAIDIKALYSAARQDRGRLQEARTTALDYIAQERQLTAKEAMNVINILKLSTSSADINSAAKLVFSTNGPRVTPKIDTGIFNNLLDGCSKIGDITLAESLVCFMKETDVPQDHITYTSLIRAYTNTGDWGKAMSIIEEMERSKDHLKPDVICYSAAISVCAKAGRFKEALGILERMTRLQMEVDSVAYNSVLQAFAQEGEWILALRFIDHMRTVSRLRHNKYIQAQQSQQQHHLAGSNSSTSMPSNPTPSKPPKPLVDGYSYAAVLRACDRARRVEELIRLLDDMTEIDHLPPQECIVPYNIALNAVLRDLDAQFLDNYFEDEDTHTAFEGGGRGGSQSIAVAVELFYKMQALGIVCSPVTCCTIITGLARAKHYATLLTLWQSPFMRKALTDAKFAHREDVRTGYALFGAAMVAAEKLGDAHTAMDIVSFMRELGLKPDTDLFNLAIATMSKVKQKGKEKEKDTEGKEGVSAGGYESAFMLFAQMKELEVGRTVQTYNHIITSCKAGGLWKEAVLMLKVMQRDNIPPDTVSYSAAISVCVVSRQWGLALDLLDTMETQGIPRNAVTYNSAIEALDAAEETVRSELVYQSALRAGIYKHWLEPPVSLPDRDNDENEDDLGDGDRYRDRDRDRSSDRERGRGRGMGSLDDRQAVMDLHRFPLAVARAAVMHVLGEIVAKRIQIPARLVIITGRGRHVPSPPSGYITTTATTNLNALIAPVAPTTVTTTTAITTPTTPTTATNTTTGPRRGVLRTELQQYIEEGLGLRLGGDQTQAPSQTQVSQTSQGGGKRKSEERPNPGRIYITQRNLEEWVQRQYDDDREQRREAERREEEQERGGEGATVKRVSVHKGNLFLKVAFAKYKAGGGGVDVRAVCPFSSATVEGTVEGAE